MADADRGDQVVPVSATQRPLRVPSLRGLLAQVAGEIEAVERMEREHPRPNPVMLRRLYRLRATIHRVLDEHAAVLIDSDLAHEGEVLQLALDEYVFSLAGGNTWHLVEPFTMPDPPHTLCCLPAGHDHSPTRPEGQLCVACAVVITTRLFPSPESPPDRARALPAGAQGGLTQDRGWVVIGDDVLPE